MTRSSHHAPATPARSPRRRLAWLAALAVPLVGLCLPSPVAALVGDPSPGQLDDSFGNGGTVLDWPPGSDIQSARSAVQPDGKIVVAGHSQDYGVHRLRLTRFERDGALDTTFRTDSTYFSGSAKASAVAVQPDGRIVVVGEINSGWGGGSNFLVARYDADGNLDQSFGYGGMAETDLWSGVDVAADVVVQADGKLVVVGQAATVYGIDVAVVRYTSWGDTDPSFGGGSGRVVVNLEGDERARSVAVQPDGAIVVGGAAQGDDGGFTALMAARLNPDGSMDSGFGGSGYGGGIEWIDVGEDERGGAIALQWDGKIVVGGTTRQTGSTDHQLALVRLFRDGSRDWYPGVTDLGPGSDVLGDIATYNVMVDGRPDARIVAVGTVNEPYSSFGIVSFGWSGWYDSYWSTEVNFSGSDVANDVLIQDGKIVTVGSAYTDQSPAMALARHHAGVTLLPDECLHRSDSPGPATCPDPDV